MERERVSAAGGRRGGWDEVDHCIGETKDFRGASGYR